MDLAVTDIASTALVVTLTSFDAGADLIEIQLGTTPDFSWEMAPIYAFTANPVLALEGLNQQQRYFLRARAVLAGGVRGKWTEARAAFTPLRQGRVMVPTGIVIQPALIVPPDAVLQWSCASEIPGFPARSLDRDDPNSVLMARKVDGVVAFDCRMSGAPVDTLALLQTNAAEECTITARAANSQSDLSEAPGYVSDQLPFRASANLPGRRGYHALLRLPKLIDATWWRIEIRGPMPADTFAATYAVFGRAHVTKNFAAESMSEVVADAGALDRDRSGNPSRTSGFRGRTVDFEIAWMTEQEYQAEYEQLKWRLGATGSALVVPNAKPGAFLHDRMLYGNLVPQAVTGNSSLRSTQPFRIQSLI